MPQRDENGDGITDVDYDSLGTSAYTQYNPALTGTLLAHFTGDDAKRTAAENESARRQQDRMWQELRNSAPGIDDLSVDYGQVGTTDEYGNLIGDPSQLEGFGASDDQRAALEALRELSRGGLSDADRAMMRAGHQRTAQALAGQNAAATRAMEARGMGGSGASLAAQMSNAQGMAGANAQSDAAMMGSAQQRAMQALMGYTDQGNAMQAQEMQRRSALDRFNQQQVDWRRNRAAFNTGLQGQTGASRAAAHQQNYENRERTVFAQNQQSQQNQGQRQQDAVRQDAANGAAWTTIGSGVEGIGRGIAGGMGG